MLALAFFLAWMFPQLAAAQDLTGRWTGTFTVTSGPEGDARPGPALLILQHNGSVLTGTAGPNEEDRKTIKDGKVEDGRITFALETEEGAVMRFTLKYEGGEIRGEVRGQRGAESMSATLSVKREKKE